MDNVPLEGEQKERPVEELQTLTSQSPAQTAAASLIAGEEVSYDGNLNLLLDVNMELTVELGRTYMSVRQVLELQKGSVVELSRVAGDSVDIYVNDHLISRGDVVVVDDKFGIRVTELIPTKKWA